MQAASKKQPSAKDKENSRKMKIIHTIYQAAPEELELNTELEYVTASLESGKALNIHDLTTGI